MDTLTRGFLLDIARPIAETFLTSDSIRFNLLRVSTMDAFAFPNGSTYFSNGLLLRVNTESQLAFIIAHELAHVKEAHSLSQYDQRKQAMVSAHVLDMLLLGTGLAYIPAAASQAQYSRAHEIEADSMAMSMIHELGYPLETVPALYDILDQVSPAASARWSAYRSHPSNQERKQRLVDQITVFGPDSTEQDSLENQLPFIHNRLFHECIRNTLLRKEYSLSHDLIQPALARDSLNPLFHYYLGELFLSQANHTDATASDYWRFNADINLKNLKESYSDSVGVWYQKALYEFETSLDIDSSFVLGHKGLGLVAYHQNNLEEGIAQLRQYLTIAVTIPDQRYLTYLIKKMEQDL